VFVTILIDWYKFLLGRNLIGLLCLGWICVGLENDQVKFTGPLSKPKNHIISMDQN
jgi:hypothetical protein